jgi:single-strand DNA-binding protein
MSSVNKAILIGRLGSDPELKYIGKGDATPVCNMSLATSSRYKDKEGQWIEKTEWHKVVVWGKQAENCAEYLAKGRQCYVEGRIVTDTWEDKEGNKRKTTKINAESVQFLGGNSDGPRQQPELTKGGGFQPDPGDEPPF